jgi:hypothetical protein
MKMSTIDDKYDAGERIEKRIQRLCAKYSLRSIKLSVSSNGGVAARAMPDGHGPIVTARRDKAFAAAAETRSSLSMDEAEKILTDVMSSVAQGHGGHIDAALTSLEISLKKGDD